MRNFFMKILVKILLLVIYAYFFGQHSILKYLNQSLVITNKEETSTSIIPPGNPYWFFLKEQFWFLSALILWPGNSKGHGWDYSSCTNTTGEDLINCLSGVAYSSEDIILNPPQLINKSTGFFLDQYRGVGQSLMIDPGMVTNSRMTTLQLELNYSLSYSLFITDPTLQFIFGSPDILPRSLLTLKQSAGFLYVYLKVNKQNLYGLYV